MISKAIQAIALAALLPEEEENKWRYKDQKTQK